MLNETTKGVNEKHDHAFGAGPLSLPGSDATLKTFSVLGLQLGV